MPIKIRMPRNLWEERQEADKEIKEARRKLDAAKARRRFIDKQIEKEMTVNTNSRNRNKNGT